MIGRTMFCLLSVFAMMVCLTVADAQQRSPEPRPSGKRSAVPREENSPVLSGRRETKAAPRSITFTPEREAAALTFVRAHRPELAPVLEDLNRRQPAEYQRAICDFFWTSETLAAIRQEDPQRYELSLEAWKLEVQTHLLASQLANRRGV
jgi:hypothetical protein